MSHFISLDSHYFKAIELGIMPFDTQKDKGFKLNDIVVYRENGTDRILTKTITFITAKNQKEGYVAFAIK